ncbi:MAG: hypothetical protein U0794_09950 [Isosphaeraceae bacterium]
MSEIPSAQNEANDEEPGRSLDHDGIDWVSAVMALATALALIGAVWSRYGPSSNPPRNEHPGLGSTPSALTLASLADGTPRVIALGGTAGRVVWVSFWSAAAPTATADLAALEPVWNRLRSRPRFTMAVAAVEADQANRVRAVVATSTAGSGSMPLYLATPATSRAFGAEGSALPLHLLFDTSGRVISVARGRDPATIGRLLEQAERRLEEFEPLGPTRFASAH